ncbi:hypothetical protein NMG60_11020865 [Bertholletia excelsa]
MDGLTFSSYYPKTTYLDDHNVGADNSRTTRRFEVINGKDLTVRRVYTLAPPLSPAVTGGWTTTSPSPSKPRRKSFFNDRGLSRRKRIATYKYYSIEGKVKDSLRKGFRWLKRRCSKMVHGF